MNPEGRFVIRYGDDASSADNYEDEKFYDDCSYLIDTKTNLIVWADGGEPEDMTLDRNLRYLVDLLNELAKESV